MLNQLGMRDAFDAVYGASAGALNATYFLSGQLDGVRCVSGLPSSGGNCCWGWPLLAAWPAGTAPGGDACVVRAGGPQAAKVQHALKL